MGDLAGLQRCLLPYPHSTEFEKVSEVLPKQVGHSFYKGGQGGKTHSTSQGYPDAPVPRQLVTESPLPGNLPTIYPDPLGPLPTVRVGSKHKKIGIDSTAGLQFCRLLVRSVDRSGPTHSGPVGNPSREVKIHQAPEKLHSQTIHVFDRTSYSNRETGVVGSSAHETHSMALEATLAWPTSAPPSTFSSAVYRCLKRRLGHTLKGLHCKRRLVSFQKSPPHILSGVKGSTSGPKEFRASLQGPDCSYSEGQHDCSLIHKQTGRYEIRLSLCPPLETSVLVSPKRNNSQGSTHSGSVECDSRQAIQTQPADPDRTVPVSAHVQSLVFEMGPATGRPMCNLVQQQTSQVCVTRTGSDSLGCGRTESVMGKPGCLCLFSGLCSTKWFQR